MLSNVCVFEELVFFDLWIPDSGFRFPVSGFRFRNPDSDFRFLVSDSGFRVLGLPGSSNYWMSVNYFTITAEILACS